MYLEQCCFTDFLYSQREMQKYEQHLLQRYWENQSDQKNCELLSASLLSKTNIRRSREVFIFQLFTGHCQLKGFLYKAWKAESPKCACGENENTIEHFVLQCQNYSDIRNKFNLPCNLEEAFHHPCLGSYIGETRRFTTTDI